MADNPHRIERREERLVARTVPELKGRVRAERRVIEEPATVDVDVSRHQVAVERRRVDRPLADAEAPVMTRDGTTVLLVTEERLEVRKVPWVVEEIHLTRRELTERQSVSDIVRREVIDVHTDGDVGLDQDARRGT
jgi:uncharacterized protein (TIGR02271 family)